MAAAAADAPEAMRPIHRWVHMFSCDVPLLRTLSVKVSKGCRMPVSRDRIAYHCLPAIFPGKCSEYSQWRPTGIVQGKATVRSVRRQGEFASLSISFPVGAADGVQIGASVSINGTCLTVSDCTYSALCRRRRIAPARQPIHFNMHHAQPYVLARAHFTRETQSHGRKLALVRDCGLQEAGSGA